MEPIITQDIYYKCHEHSHEAKLVLKNSRKSPGAGLQHCPAQGGRLPGAAHCGPRGVSALRVRAGKSPPRPCSTGRLAWLPLWTPVCHQTPRRHEALGCRSLPTTHSGNALREAPRALPRDAHGIASAPRAGARLPPSSGTASRVPTETCDKVTVQLQSDSLVLKLN